MPPAKKKNTNLMDAILVFADGACKGNPGPGGWGVVIATPDGSVQELGGSKADTTNNRMELTAAGQGLRALESTPGKVVVLTDSVYVIFGITKWVWGWQKRGWKTAQGEEVANIEYWKRLSAILAARKEKFPDDGPVEWKYVRGHVGIPGNERVDEIAVAFSKGEYIQLYKGSLLKYPVAIHDLPEKFEEPELKKREAPKEAYSYVSVVGGSAKKHATWRECEGRVKGVSGAKFKKTMSREEEAEILAGWGFDPDKVE